MSVPIAIVGAATAPPRSSSPSPPVARSDRLVDPRQRLFLSCARSALEDAGLSGGAGPDTGVFASSLPSGHLADLLRDPEARARGITPMLLLGNTVGFTAEHAARGLGSTGPNVTMPPGQESSLTAVHRACAALADRQCRTAVAGGVADGASGGVAGSAAAADCCAVVVLQRLDEALAGGRRVLGVIRDTARGASAAVADARAAGPAAGAERLIAAARGLRQAGPVADNGSLVAVSEHEPGGTRVHCVVGPAPESEAGAVPAGPRVRVPAAPRPEPGPRRMRSPRPPGRALIRLRRGADGRDLFLVHPAGGNVFGYHDLLAHSRYPGSVWALRYPFERLRELSGVPAMAGAYLDEIRAVRPDGPLLLGGYSFGGTVAFEIARRLQQEGEPVERLLLIDALPGAVVPRLGLQDFLDALPEFAESVLRLRIPRAAPPPTTLGEALELLRQPGWSDSAAAEHRRFLQVFWSNSQALTRYRPYGYRLRSPVTLVNADAAVPPAFFARLGLRTDPETWWRDRLAAPPRVLRTTGDHYSIFHDTEHRRALAAVLDRALDPYPKELP